MKRTDIERRDRELKRQLKKEQAQGRREGKGISSAEYCESLLKLFMFDDEKIYNIQHSVEILELVESMSLELEEKEMDNIIRKAIRLTKIKGKKKAFEEVKALLS